MRGPTASEWTGAAMVIAGALALIWWRWGDPDREDRITRITNRGWDFFPFFYTPFVLWQTIDRALQRDWVRAFLYLAVFAAVCGAIVYERRARRARQATTSPTP